jgi:hypothetical protein
MPTSICRAAPGSNGVLALVLRELKIRPVAQPLYEGYDLEGQALAEARSDAVLVAIYSM